MPNALYNITAPMAVRRPIAIIGRPLGTPTLDAHLTFRTFQIEAGGRLDLRYVRIYRGASFHPFIPPPSQRHKTAIDRTQAHFFTY